MEPVRFSGFDKISLENLSFSYGPGEPVIFDGVTCDLPLGRNVLVQGEGGGGQSTLLKLLAVMVQPQSGRLIFNDLDTTELSFEEFLPIRLKIGYSFDLGGLLANRTLQENLTLPLLYHKVCSLDEANSRVVELAQDFGFLNSASKRPAMVSGGLRKFVTILRALILDPELLILDDPFTGIGVESAGKLIRLLEQRRNEGRLKHVFLTSREDIWASRLGCDSLSVSRTRVQFDGKRVAS